MSRPCFDKYNYIQSTINWKRCKFCDFKTKKIFKHFTCQFKKCNEICFNSCIFKNPYCDKCSLKIKKMEEYLDLNEVIQQL